MIRVRVESDLDICRKLWEACEPRTCLFDLWPVRACFFPCFSPRLHFLEAREGGRRVGLLPLVRDEASGQYVSFPGEMWRGRTWLEQNRIRAASLEVAEALLSHVPGPLRLRYLAEESLVLCGDRAAPDETNYQFLPHRYRCSFHAYRAALSSRSRRHIDEELGGLGVSGISWRFDCFDDLDLLLCMNQRTFGSESYFDDRRFLEGFLALAHWLRRRGMARMTTVLVGGRVAAVDFGGLYRGHCTLLAGGTDPEFPGVAKCINLHHIERAYVERLRAVDFLCGDFGWKERFHLLPRPLYQLNIDPDTRREVRDGR